MDSLLKSALKIDTVEFVRTVEGGLVNKAAIYHAGGRNVFVKTNDVSHARQLFESEEESLKTIAATSVVRTPTTFGVYDNLDDGSASLLMECLPDLKPISSSDGWTRLGEIVARIHLHNKQLLQASSTAHVERSHQNKPLNAGKDAPVLQPQKNFGYHVPSFFGSHFRIEPTWKKSWQEYFTENLLNPIYQQILEKFACTELQEQWSILLQHMDYFFKNITITPSILIGDLAAINLGETEGEIVIFDPCCLYGFSEFDLTQALAFDEFQEPFYEAYFKLIPKQERFEERLMLHKLFAYLLCWTYEIEGMEQLAKTELRKITNMLTSV
ncbi:unnamed protein product [Owenia fusiformis]|uniref:protein-ribulosamine 3-kinase n=1 Tax=Owenia fusiformis TaxID=6347 RepID=A0A8J1XGC5_OWEFU|nr:unnamed protein product [Owenia fusiformis]